MLDNPQPQMISYMMASLRTMSQKVHLPTCCPTAACFTAFICSAVELLPHYYISVGLHCIDHAVLGFCWCFFSRPGQGKEIKPIFWKLHVLLFQTMAWPGAGLLNPKAWGLQLARSCIVQLPCAQRLEGTHVQFRCVTTGMHQIEILDMSAACCRNASTMCVPLVHSVPQRSCNMFPTQ